MIYVEPKLEPESFDKKVRQKGLKHLKKKNIALSQPLPQGTKIEPYWRSCLNELYVSYQGICAYLSIFFERVTGGGTVEHFIAKSKRADLAYEWSNYRLASSIVNSRKCDYDDVLDPFEVEDHWFYMELLSGKVYPNPDLNLDLQEKIHSTIKRLALNHPECKEVRTRHFQNYINQECTAEFLKKISPFVWREADRQGLL